MRLLATLGACLLCVFASASPLHNIVIFGDSLSDNGNLYEYMNHQLPQSPPYFEGRFSNGPVWIEHLSSFYFPIDPKAHTANYAVGGAGVSMNEEDDDVLFTLRREVTSYLLSHQDKASEDSLYILWIGANNYLAMPSNVERALKEVNEGITQSLQKLVEKGAKHILVLNLPDLGKSPIGREFGSAQELSYFANQHNEALNQTISSFKQTNPDVNWLFLDMNRMFGEVLENPAEFGFTNTTDSCFGSVVDEITKKSVLKIVASVKVAENQKACDGYLFFDLVHPTAVAHQIMAEKVRLWLDDVGIQFTEETSK
jgi:phospholipase/lecithinase/hemolysin